MADIGNLYYGIHFKDYSDEDIKKIKEKVKKELSTKFGIKLDFSASKSALRNSVKDALKDQKFKIDVVVDKASTQKAVRQALSKLGLNYNTTASDVRNARIEAIQQKSLIDQQLMQEKVRQQMIRNQKAEDALSNARSRGTFSIENQTSNVSKLRKEQGLLNEFMGKQSGLASQLGTQFYNMYSLVAVKRFLTSVITIGGEFEKQRIALKSILGDATKANILFSQIKTLAVESPFEFKELTSYAKQLSAFSIPYEELYDTTKRLADISAGLGVDMGRIILAYGQVRSAAFLRGQEVRQFTEAGIPLIDELANKFEKLEGKAVSAGEVFDRISKRQVSFKMVKDVLWDLTDEGGKFFNMQEELAESLSGKYANLRDSYDIMLSEMADSNNSNLKGGLELLTSLMNHWEGVANAIASAVVAVGAYKAVMAVAAAVSFVKGIYGAMQMVKVINALTGATKTLTAAQILATAINPWVAIAAAVGIAAGAFVLLRDNAKSAQELISDMNDAAAGIKDTFDKTSGIEKNLGVYDELSKKINRSAKENQRLDDVMRSLAKSVPDAIMAFDDYGNVLSIDVDKVKKYTESQRKMTEEGLEARIEDAQIRIVEINRKISEKQSELATKEEAQATWGTITPEAIRKAKIEISDLNNESVSLQNSINGARDALSKIKSLGDETPTALTGWRKIASDVLQSFKSLKQYEPKDDDEHVEWLKKIAKAYKDLGKEIAMAKSISFFDPEMLTQMEAEYNGLERIISAFGANADSLAGDKGSKKDAVADKYKERLDLLKDAYSEYKKWSALVGKDAAANKVKESGIFDSLFKGNEPVNIEDYNKELDKILASLSDKTEAQRGLKISIRKLKLDIDSDARKDAIDGLKKDMESIVANMAERWDLFKNLSKTMGNKKMAMNLAFGGEVSFGSEVEELGSMIKKEISAKNIGIGFDELIKMTPENIEKMGKDTFGVVSLLVKNYQDANKKLKAETLNTAAELVAKYRKYQDEITAIHEQANRDIEALEKNRVKFGDKYTDQAITGVRKKENEDVAAKAFDEFKKSDEWAKTFEDLDKISSATINRIISKIEEFKQTAGKDLPVEDFKTLINTLEKLKNETYIRNPFKALVDGIKETSEAWKEYRQAKADVETIRNGGKILVGTSVGEEKTTTTFTENGIPIQIKEVGKLTMHYETLADAENKANKAKDEMLTSRGKMQKGFTEIANGVNEAAGAVGNLSSVFESLGNEDFADSLSEMQGIMSGIGGLASAGAAFASGHVLEGITGTIGGITGIIGSIAQAHDKKLDKAIQRSQVEVQKLTNLYSLLESKLKYTLGEGFGVDLSKELEDIQAKVQNTQSSLKMSIIKDAMLGGGKQSENTRILGDLLKAQKKMASAAEDKNYYAFQRANLEAQMAEIEKQRKAEEDKKKTDKGKIEDYNNQIVELRQQVADFAEEAADALYGINLKDWASQLGDTLYEAWKKGEDGAEAFKKKSAEIMGDVMNEILKTRLLQPAMEQLQKALFGEDGASGFFGNDFSLDDKEMEAIADVLMGISSKTEGYYDALDKLNEYMEKKYGVSMKEEAESSGLSKGIEGVTEDTANLLASYINSIRADVSVKRMLLEKFVNELVPRTNYLAEAQLQQLQQIQINTKITADRITELNDNVNAVIDGHKKFNVK